MRLLLKLPRRFYVILAITACAGIVTAFMGHLGWFLFSLASVLALAIIACCLYFRRSLPQVNGVVKVKGLAAPVKIIRDSDFIPHIYAKGKHDAYWGLGYVHAQDRLWQMEFQRRTGYGRVSEILGSKILMLDRFIRTLGIHRHAAKVWESLPGETRQIINAYVAGINAFLDAHGPSRLAPEFTMLRLKPEPWTGTDVVVISKIIAWNLGGTYLTELLCEDLIEAVGSERANQLIPYYFEQGSYAKAQGQGAERDMYLAESPNKPGLIDTAIFAGQGDGSNLWAAEEGTGSNLWVVGPEKSETGGAVLANDPHLLSSLPMIWYLAHLSADDIDVIGSTIPGLPGIIMGRNEHISWGITNLNPDVQDLFRERLDADGQMAEFQGKVEPMNLITETIKVKNKPDFQLKVRVTRHGPLISDVLDAVSTGLPLATRKRAREPLALQWTGLLDDDKTLNGMLLLNEARNWEEFKNALKHYVSPSVNFGYADVAGNIGYHAAGKVPIRKGGDGSAPAEGWSGENEWVDFIPFEEMPHQFNPSQNYVVSTNNSPPPRDYAYFLGKDWVEPYRKQRITELLEARKNLSVNDFMAMQADTISMHARESLPLLLPLIETDDAEIREAIHMLDEWDCDAAASSVATSIFAAWWVWLPRVFLSDELDQKLIKGYEVWVSYVNRFIQNVLTGRTPVKGDPSKLAQQALTKALDDLKSKLGEDMTTWRWDRLHKAVFPHYPFNSLPLLRRLFSRSVRNGGDWSTINFGSFTSNPPFTQRNIPGYRQIVDMANPDGGFFIQAVGQSGHFLSPHYDEYLKDWVAVRYRSMRFRRASVERDAKATLRLEPEAVKD